MRVRDRKFGLRLVACIGVPCGVLLQADGATPLYAASEWGHAECVRALLNRGAAINKAMVGFACPIALHGLGCVGGHLWEPACALARLRESESKSIRLLKHYWRILRMMFEGGLFRALVCRAVSCCRRMGTHRCSSPAKGGTWSACGLC